MARFSKTTLQQVGGIDGPILAQELVFNQKDFWNLEFTQTDDNGVVTPIPLTGSTISAKIIRRKITNLEETRTGLAFDLSNWTDSTPVAIDLPVTNRVDGSGKVTIGIDDSAWGVMATDAELDIDVVNPVCFSGHVKVSYPANGSNPAYDEILFLLFLVRNDGVMQ